MKLASLMALLVLICPLQTFAAVNYFLKINGVDGESSDADHKDWIEVLSVDWGAHRDVSIRRGNNIAPRVSRSVASMSMHFTKQIDSATPELFNAVVKGERIPEVILSGVDDGERRHRFYYVVMQDVHITSVSTSASGGEQQVTENVSLNYAQISMTYQTVNEDGSMDDPVQLDWSMRRGKH